MWCLVLTGLCHLVSVQGWIGFMLLSEMPSYFKDELGFSLSTAGTLCIAPYGGMLLSTMVSGEVFKHCILKRGTLHLLP
jgi:hypothetical protein